LRIAPQRASSSPLRAVINKDDDPILQVQWRTAAAINALAAFHLHLLPFRDAFDRMGGKEGDRE
jgi:hypothetical protein